MACSLLLFTIYLYQLTIRLNRVLGECDGCALAMYLLCRINGCLDARERLEAQPFYHLWIFCACNKNISSIVEAFEGE